MIQDKSDTFSNGDLLGLMNSIQNGNRGAEEELVKRIEPLFLQVARNRKWKDMKQLDIYDRAQTCLMHMLETLRQGGHKIENAEAWLRRTAENHLKNEYEKERAQKRGDGKDTEILEEGTSPSSAPGPDEIYARREGCGGDESGDERTDEIAREYLDLPPELRTVIEKSLNLVSDLFQTRLRLREKLRGGVQHDRHVLKVIELIARARQLMGKKRGNDLQDPGFRRLLEMRAQDPPPVSGRPDDKKLEEWLRENRELEEKYGAALNLFEAQLTLFAELIRPEAALLLSPEPLGLARDIVWIDHLSEIAGMRLSPLSMIYEIWSRAPAFSKGKLGTYRNRDNLGIPFRYHKIASKGTPREILFKSISIASLDNPAKALDGIRKAGYSHALKEKYRPIIDLIYRLSFLGNEKKRLPLRVAAPFLGAAILPR